MKWIEVTKLSITALLAFGVAWMMFGRDGGGVNCKREGTFSFKTTDGISISSKAEGCNPDTLSLITALLKESSTREVILNQVKKDETLFAIHDPTWVAQLGRQLCPSYNVALAGAARTAAARECVRDPVAAELRTHQRARRAPFMHLAEEKTMGVPPTRYRPAKGFANGCRGETGLHTKHVRVSNPGDAQRFVDVEVSGSYNCDDGDTYPDIQLSAEDALDVLGGKKVPDKLTTVMVIEQGRA